MQWPSCDKWLHKFYVSVQNTVTYPLENLFKDFIFFEIEGQKVKTEHTKNQGRRAHFKGKWDPSGAPHCHIQVTNKKNPTKDNLPNHQTKVNPQTTISLKTYQEQINLATSFFPIPSYV